MKFLIQIAVVLTALLSAHSAKANPNAPVILVFGDSLSAEYGIARGSGWVTLLSDRLRREGFPHRVINASISGETTAGGLSRLGTTLKKQQPQFFLLALGANDGLRGLPVAQTRKNIESMLTLAANAGAQSMVIGIRMPPNYGPEYTRAFDRLFEDIALRRSLPVVPFLLEGIAENPSYFQADAIHPNEKAQPRILNNVWPTLSKLLQPQTSAPSNGT
ncbi:MAG: Arylesterase, partial [Pseudomonadota bacterium]